MDDDVLADKAEISRRIKAAREAAGMTLLDVELAIDYSAAGYWRLEVGRSYPHLRTAAKLARLFGITIDELVLRDEDK